MWTGRAIALGIVLIGAPAIASAQPTTDDLGRPVDRVSVATDRTVDIAEADRAPAKRRVQMVDRQVRKIEAKKARAQTASAPPRTSKTVGVWADVVAQVHASPADPN